MKLMKRIVSTESTEWRVYILQCGQQTIPPLKREAWSSTGDYETMKQLAFGEGNEVDWKWSSPKVIRQANI